MVAYADTRGRNKSIQMLLIPQLIGPGEIAERTLLPSLRYHPVAAELTTHDKQLPWPAAHSSLGDLDEEMPEGIIGEFAQSLGSKVPGRLVVSAKSWLSHGQVDRSAPILPWGADDSVEKISPLHASASYLAYVRATWNQRFPDYPLTEQDVVLTLPASFDEAARALTVQAARLAQLDTVHLLEEPQAACYDWLHLHQHDLQQALAETRLLLVCDIGGGTTDLTLIQIKSDEQGGFQFDRIGVGDHLMLGGDNMDLALARIAEQRLTEQSKPLPTTQLAQLIQQCRSAKERLLAKQGPEHVNVTLLGSGSRLIGGSRSTALSREEVLKLVLDGFFPQIDTHAKPEKRRSAIIEFGLPYVADPAISRHLAVFLARYREVSQTALGHDLAGRHLTDHNSAIPDAVLLNGGVFHSQRLSERLLTTLADWRGKPLNVLQNDDPDLAVARGAVAYAMARRGRGLKIGGGSARSYFLMIDNHSHDGQQAQTQQGVCLLPRGSAEGRPITLEKRSFALRLGQPVRFHLTSTTAAKRYRAGELVTVDDEAFTPLPPIATVLETHNETHENDIPVQLKTELTEIGTLAMSCVATESPQQQWQLEFQLRGDAAGRLTDEPIKRHPRFDNASDLIKQFYGDRSKNVDPKAIKSLRQDLEKILGRRDGWDTPLLRELFSVLLTGAKRRRRSLDHERLWFNLTGFCLRPGFGYPLDDWRIEQLWPLFAQGLHHVKEPQLWAEWWTFWRRIAGGLSSESQQILLDDIAPYLQPPSKNSKNSKIRGPKKQGYDDMVRLVAALEHLPAERKQQVGDWLLQRLHKKQESPQTWWAVGRLGTRIPFYGSAHNVVPTDVASHWLDATLALDWRKVQAAAFAATLLARMCGDRERDLTAQQRQQVAQRLRTAKASTAWAAMVLQVTHLDEQDEKRLFGDALPPGLKLVS